MYKYFRSMPHALFELSEKREKVTTQTLVMESKSVHYTTSIQKKTLTSTHCML